MPPLPSTPSPTLPRREEPPLPPTLALRDLTSTLPSSTLPCVGTMPSLHPMPSTTLPRREVPPLPPTLARRGMTSTPLSSMLPRG